MLQSLIACLDHLMLRLRSDLLARRLDHVPTCLCRHAGFDVVLPDARLHDLKPVLAPCAAQLSAARSERDGCLPSACSTTNLCGGPHVWHADDPMMTCRKIVNWRMFLAFPDDAKLPAAARDLIERLLCDVDDRLGTHGVDEIKVRA